MFYIPRLAINHTAREALVAQARTRHRRTKTLAAAALALGLACWGLLTAHAQEVVRQALITPGNAQPIQIYADTIATWTEGGRRAFLLRGKVSLEQGAVAVKMPQGVVWVDEEAKQKSGVYNLDVYGEGRVAIDNGPLRDEPDAALVQLATRGEVRIKAYGGPVKGANQANDALYQRASAIKATQPPRAEAPVQSAAAPKPLASDLKATPALPPPTPPSASMAAIQQVQALQPPPAPVVSPVPPSVQPPTLQPPLPSLDPPTGPSRRFVIRPRTSKGIEGRGSPETGYVIPSGVIVSIGEPNDPKGFLDIEADRMVIWTKGNPQQVFAKMQSPEGETSNSLELYLTGNVEIRTLSKSKNKEQSETLRADEVYYDVGRNVAIALRSDLEIRDPKLPNPIHFQAEEFFRINEQLYKTNQVQVYSTTLPSDPGLKIEVRQATVEERKVTRKNIFGLVYTDRDTGEPQERTEHYFKGRDMIVRLEGIPIFYFPWINGRIEDPLGPLDGVSFGANRAFGFHIYTTWDVFDLIGMERPENTRWRFMVDYMTSRGPALGTEFKTAGTDLLGINNKYDSLTDIWGLHDSGTDLLGANRGTVVRINPTTTVPVAQHEWRGRILDRTNIQELPWGFSLQAQLGLISDRNFMEQFYKQQWDNDLNQETSIYLKQQQDRWAWSFLVEPRVRQWLTETEWLPRADGYVIGQKFLDLFTYNAHGSVGYARLRPAEYPSYPYAASDAATNTGRFDVIQDISLPVQAGPFKVVPYAVFDLTYYSNDLTGDDQGRVYGGGGLRTSIPFSKLYPDVDSELFNLNGIYHKIVASANWYVAGSNTRYTTLPQLDRFNDDVSDQALRDIRPWQPLLYPTNAAFLATPLFDPQAYALRRLVFTQIDTLDQINVAQLDLRQRWQTKRGIPGNQHVVDWMTLDMGVSVFPQSDRDNFGEPLGIINYDWLWNIGDRTALTSNGWFETIEGGPRVWNGGIILNRPDATNFYLGYRQIDPLNSKAVVASVTYALSAKYAATASTVWDFGVHNQNYSFMLTRIGTDVRVSFGLSYNSIINNFGVQFEIVPNLIRGGRNSAFAPGGISSGALARR